MPRSATHSCEKPSVVSRHSCNSAYWLRHCSIAEHDGSWIGSSSRLARLKIERRARLAECLKLAPTGQTASCVAEDIRQDFAKFNAECDDAKAFRCWDETVALRFGLPAPPTSSLPPKKRDDSKPVWLHCEFPISNLRRSCADCRELGALMNCTAPGHMPLCGNAIHTACHNCQRVLCGLHFRLCYCELP